MTINPILGVDCHTHVSRLVVTYLGLFAITTVTHGNLY